MKTEADKNYYYANDDFKQYFVPYDLGYTKKRIGPKYDGGYIIYEELLKPVNHIFSFGIGTEWVKEFELESMGKTIHMYDLIQFDISKLKNKNMKFKLAEINSSYLDSELDKIEEKMGPIYLININIYKFK